MKLRLRKGSKVHKAATRKPLRRYRYIAMTPAVRASLELIQEDVRKLLKGDDLSFNVRLEIEGIDMYVENLLDKRWMDDKERVRHGLPVTKKRRKKS